MNQQFIRGLTIDWDKIDRYSYLRDIEALNGLEHLEFKKPITFLVGENGSGKSTLLEAIAVGYGFNPEGGTKNYNFSTYDSHSELCNAMRIEKGIRRAKGGYFLRAESFYNVATKEMEYADSAHPSALYHEKSHGESFLALAQDYLGPDGIYIFDEPEAGIDLWSFSMLVQRFEEIHATKKESIIIISHQERIIQMADRIMVIEDGRIKAIGTKDEIYPSLMGSSARHSCIEE